MQLLDHGCFLPIYLGWAAQRMADQFKVELEKFCTLLWEAFFGTMTGATVATASRAVHDRAADSFVPPQPRPPAPAPLAPASHDSCTTEQGYLAVSLALVAAALRAGGVGGAATSK